MNPNVVKLDYRLFAASLGYRADSTMLARCTHCHIILKAYGLPTLSSYSLIGFGLVYVMHIWFTRDTLQLADYQGLK
jgi:hypothetical protein